MSQPGGATRRAPVALPETGERALLLAAILITHFDERQPMAAPLRDRAGALIRTLARTDKVRSGARLTELAFALEDYLKLAARGAAPAPDPQSAAMRYQIELGEARCAVRAQAYRVAAALVGHDWAAFARANQLEAG